MLQLSETVSGSVVLRSFFRFLLLWPFSGIACAVETSYPPGFAAGVAQMLLGLGAVIALLLLTLWLIRRLSIPRGNAARLKVLGAVAIGPRERVVLLDVAGTVLVLGVTGNSVTTLHTLAAEQWNATTPPAEMQPSGEFTAWLGRSLERRQHEA